MLTHRKLSANTHQMPSLRSPGREALVERSRVLSRRMGRDDAYRVTVMIYTVGHSNLTAEAFAQRLQAWDVDLLVDVRRYPSSRRHPHFNRPSLAAYLEEQGIRYLHEERLGGHRAARADSPHTALSEAFRGYADHMRTRPFHDAVRRLVDLAGDHVTAVMCAEADPTHCHRRFLADALAVRDVEVVHILSVSASRPHELHSDARVEEDGVLAYPDLSPQQMELFG